jgi:glycosyltransferase involved in cell wall biosynthesis
MNYLPNARLLLVGAGEEWEAAKRIASGREPANQIIVWPKQPYERLRQLTASADVGLSLDKGIHMNYYFSLPNKLFDYIHAGIPVVASPLPEVRAVVNEYEVGVIIDDWSPERIADAVNQVLDKGKASYAERLQIAAERYNWQRETVAIKEVVQKVYFSKH